MAKTAIVRARVEPGLKREAEGVFSRLGLSATEAIQLFYKQVTLQHGLPFAVKTPDAGTCEALRQAYERQDLTDYEVWTTGKSAHG